MGGYAPAFLAMLMNLNNIHVFKEAKTEGHENSSGPFLSNFIFMVAVFVVLSHLQLYPCHFRRLWGCGNLFIQFLYSQLMFEYILNDFWIPLQESVSNFIQNAEDYLQHHEHMAFLDFFLDILKFDCTAIICSYILSIFFLMAALHTTKIVEFKMLDCGISQCVRYVCVGAEGICSNFMNRFQGGPKCFSKFKKCPKVSSSRRKKKDEDSDESF